MDFTSTVETEVRDPESSAFELEMALGICGCGFFFPGPKAERASKGEAKSNMDSEEKMDDLQLRGRSMVKNFGSC